MKAASELAVDARKKMAEVGSQAADLISNVTNSAQETAVAAKRAVKKGLAATEDLVDDTAYRIKKHPLQSVGVTFGIGLGAGILIGWLARRK